MDVEEFGSTANVLFVDTETTGLSANAEPISIGLVPITVSLPKGHLIDEGTSYYGLRCPTVPIEPGAQRVHGMSMVDLEGKDFDYAKICELINTADFLVAHNAAFDKRILGNVLGRVGMKAWVCSVNDIFWKRLADVRNRKLDTLCAHFDISRPEPHNALGDALALRELLMHHMGSTPVSRTILGDALCYALRKDLYLSYMRGMKMVVAGTETDDTTTDAPVTVAPPIIGPNISDNERDSFLEGVPISLFIAGIVMLVIWVIAAAGLS